MKISLVTPTFNQAHFIRDTLASIEEQGHPELEHIVVDALSTDGTEAILQNYASRTGARVIREADAGQSDAINKGFAAASGEIGGWLNSDDLLFPGALGKIAAAFREHRHAAVIYGLGAKIEKDGSMRRMVPYRPFDRRLLRTAYHAVQPAMFFRLDAFRRVGGLDPDLHYAMDWELLLRLSAAGEVVAINEPIAKIRYYEETKTASGGWDRLREIAGIGLRHNGPLDLNLLSFRVRDWIARSGAHRLRKPVDHFFWNVFRGTPIMVQGWP